MTSDPTGAARAVVMLPAEAVTRQVGELVAREVSRLEDERAAEREADAAALPNLIAKGIADALAGPLEVFPQLAAAIEKSVGAGVDRAVAGLREQSEGDTRRALENERRVHELQEALRAAIAAMPPPEKGERGERGEQGPAGLLGAVTTWGPGGHVERACVTHDNALWQAVRPTDSEPGESDAWALVLRGFAFRGLHDPARAYPLNSVVQASEGAAFVATKDIGAGVECPGDGWALITKQGRTGKPGMPGIRGERGDKGEPGAPGRHGKDGAEILDVRLDDTTRGLIIELTDGRRFDYVPDAAGGAALHMRGGT